MNSIMITGANGWLGTNLIERMWEKYRVIAVSRAPKALSERFPDIISIDTNYEHIASHVDSSVIIVHCAFARNKRANSEIASSLDHAKTIFSIAAENNAYAVINISTQGVYGENTDERSEESIPNPTFPYTMAKYASELLLDSICGKAEVKFTNIRLDSLAENQNVTVGFLKQALNGNINVVKGNQKFSFLDVRDATAAMDSLISIADKNWASIYNVGWNNTRYSILELAECAANVVKMRTNKTVSITEEQCDVQLYTGMTTTLFSEATGWNPQYNMTDIFDKLLSEMIKAE